MVNSCNKQLIVKLSQSDWLLTVVEKSATHGQVNENERLKKTVAGQRVSDICAALT